MQTPQSSVFGFPNMFIGIVAFAVIITVGMALLSGARFARWYWLGLQAGVTLGFAFVVWLWFQALYEIRILCPFCMVVWAAMIPLFVWVTVRNIVHGVIPAPAGVARILGDSGWIITALLYVGRDRHHLLRLHPGIHRHLRLLSQRKSANWQLMPPKSAFEGISCQFALNGVVRELEPDLDFALGRVDRVRAVDEVLLDLQAPVAAEVAADGAGAAVVGSVVPASERKPSMTRWPSKIAATTGPLSMNSTSGS